MLCRLNDPQAFAASKSVNPIHAYTLQVKVCAGGKDVPKLTCRTAAH